jgi:hypothetical protein
MFQLGLIIARDYPRRVSRRLQLRYRSSLERRLQLQYRGDWVRRQCPLLYPDRPLRLLRGPSCNPIMDASLDLRSLSAAFRTPGPQASRFTPPYRSRSGAYSSGPCRVWVKVRNPASDAVQRERSEIWKR